MLFAFLSCLSLFASEPSLLGIVVTEDGSSITKKEALKGVHIQNKEASFLKERLLSFVDKTEISEQNLLLIQKEILRLYREKNRNLVFVEIPEQDITDGVVIYEVKSPKISSPVVYEGNYWLPSFRIEKALKLQEQAPLNENDLLNHVAFFNQNPFHSSRVVLSPGNQKGETKVEIITKDRAPIRLYSGVDNTGVESLGPIRIFAGFTWGDAFSRGDLFSYQFCTNQKYDRFHSHSANYVSYLPWEHIVALYGGYAEIHTDEMSSFLNHAKQAQGSLRYKIPIKPLYTDFQSQIYFGADYKYETSALFFVSELVITAMNQTIANLAQAVLGYQCELIRKPHQFTLQAEVFVSPAEFLPHQSSQDYSRLRAYSKPYSVNFFIFQGTLNIP